MNKIVRKICLSLIGFAVIAVLAFSINIVKSAEVDVPEYPTIKISSIPETFQADSEITLTVEQDGFTGDNLFSNWCIDGVPLNSFYAGSSDEITFDEIEENGEKVIVPRVQGEFGRQIGGSGFCNSPARPINADADNYQWWNQTNITFFDKSSIDYWTIIFGIPPQVNDSPPIIPNLSIPRTASALIVGMETQNKPMDPIFLDIDFTGDMVLSDDYEQLLNEVELADLAEAVGLKREDILLESSQSSLLVDVEKVEEVVQNVKDQDHRVDEGIDLNEVPDNIQPEYYLDAQVKLPVTDSYHTVDVSSVSEEQEKLEAQGYQVVIKWDTVEQQFNEDDSPKTTTDDDGNEINIFNVRLKIYEPVKVYVDKGGYTQYWGEVFGKTDEFDGDTKEVNKAYSEITNQFVDNTWEENRDMYYDRDRRENTMYLSRVFHIMNGDNIEGEPGDDGSPYSDLPSYKDRDTDGIPDLWEMKHFGAMAGKEITKPSEPKKKATVHFNNCCVTGDPEQEEELRENLIKIFLEQVSPTDDWEGDGFDWSNRAYREWKRKYRHYPEPWVGGLGPYIERNRVIAGGKGSHNKPGDKKLNNYEEFVMGTNPIESDTDGDGVPDELDFYGLSQETIKIKLNKDVGSDDYLITSRAYGPITRGNYEKQPHFSRADAIRNVKQGGELPLEVQLAVKPNPATLSDVVTVSAGIGNSNTVDTRLLFFQWYLNDIPIQSPPGEKIDQVCPCTPEALETTRLLGEQSGYGKTSLTFPVSLGASSACNGAKVLLEVMDSSTEQTITAEIQVPISMETVLSKSIVGNVAESGKGIGDGVIGNDQLIEEVSPSDIGGVRSNDLIAITANLIGYNPEFCGVAEVKDEEGNIIPAQSLADQEDQYMNSLSYIWYLDGIERNDLSGKGRREIEFEPTADSRIAGDDRDEEINASEADDHEIKVEIYDKEKNLISKAEEGVKVLSAYIDFDFTGSGVKKLPTTADGKTEIQVLKDYEVTIRADGQYLKPATSYLFTWERNNTEPEELESPSPIGNISFKAGSDEGFDQTEDISVTITTLNDKGEEIESVSKDIVLTVVEDVDFSGEGVEAFITKFLPKNLRGIINFTAGFSLILVIMIFAYGFKTKPNKL